MLQAADAVAEVVAAAGQRGHAAQLRRVLERQRVAKVRVWAARTGACVRACLGHTSAGACVSRSN